MGERHHSQLARNPGGNFVAMQVTVWIETTAERAAVWDTSTRKIAWNPDDANALAWVPGGEEMLGQPTSLSIVLRLTSGFNR